MANLDRRTLLQAGLAAAAGTVAQAATGTAAAQSSGKTYVLVHGAWHGGWCWSHVADALRGMGHRVTTPTQTVRPRLLTSGCGVVQPKAPFRNRRT